MSGGLNWDRAQRDTARARRYAQRHGEAPMKVDRGKPPTDKQLSYLNDLARKLGVKPAAVQTAYQARIEIDSLKQRIAVKQRVAARQ